MKPILLSAVFLAFTLSSVAQDGSDVLRLSQNFNHGTARFTSMGGAFGSLGADFTSLSYNPAGLGAYRSSSVMFTPSLKTRKDNALYLGYNSTDNRTSALLENIGLVASIRLAGEEEEGLVFLNFGLGYNRLNDFNGETTAVGKNSPGSIMDYFSWRANRAWPNSEDITISNDFNPFLDSSNPWDVILAWNTYLIDFHGADEDGYLASLNDGDRVYQEQSISTQGGIGEYTFSTAANISNRVYLGATVGIQSVYFKQNLYYTEEALNGNQLLPNGDQFYSLNYIQGLTVKGTGLNLKLGSIFRPTSDLRLGLALHTPTIYSLEEEYRASIESDFLFGTSNAESPISGYGYTVKTPLKAIGSVSYTFGKIGLISVDCEYLDYTSMRLVRGEDKYEFEVENKDIKEFYTNAINAKVGGEVWIGMLALRGGFAMYGSPNKSGFELITSSTNVYSGGFGLKLDDFTFDWAYQRVMYNDKYVPYGIAEIVSRDVTQNRFFFTLGYRF